ncbi:DUF3794 domain-containing protein [Clostridium sp. BNL1100]|uniref:DUF3794 domain-containing protein n=1 Tax=Clostridium sp. BNL1100 TaxID=755731 RepID=UPI00024A766F|nr:DUF3794 domain-containing protein [Clostridium sp. BNL1100]AEY67805.1 hypothetical protein Clo1100_3686 [Clostridium sp. BNL1100]
MSQFEINQKSQCCGGEEFDYDGGKKIGEKCIKVPEVIGRNNCQTLVECVIPFPEQYPAVEIKDIHKEVRDLIVHVCKNKVLINGILHKNINYKTYEGKCDFYCGYQKYDSYYGDVRHVAVNIPFACFIEVPGARPGDDFEIEYADVEDSCEIDILEDPIWEKGSVKQYKKLREKVIVKIDLKVLRHIQITVKPEKCNICP